MGYLHATVELFFTRETVVFLFFIIILNEIEWWPEKRFFGSLGEFKLFHSSTFNVCACSIDAIATHYIMLRACEDHVRFSQNLFFLWSSHSSIFEDIYDNIMVWTNALYMVVEILIISFFYLSYMTDSRLNE